MHHTCRTSLSSYWRHAGSGRWPSTSGPRGFTPSPDFSMPRPTSAEHRAHLSVVRAQVLSDPKAVLSILSLSAQVTLPSYTSNTATADMSVTTTSNPVTYASAAVLRDYELTHSDEEFDPSLNAHPAPSPSSQNPADWPTEHRRVPAYRPVNTELDQSQRRVYLNGIERAFVGTMFTGVFLESVSLVCEGEAHKELQVWIC